MLKALGFCATSRLRVSIGNPIDTTYTIYKGIVDGIPNAEILFTPAIMHVIRATKSENEIICLKESYRLCELALDACPKEIHPGMTEANVLGIAHGVIFANGAVTEGMPNYVFSDETAMFPLGRAQSDCILHKVSFFQLGLSASVDGYSGSVGVPVSLGRFTAHQKELVDFGLVVLKWTRENLRAGILLPAFDTDYRKVFRDAGMEQNHCYQPIHGEGLAEVEEYRPNDNDPAFLIWGNHTFQIDNFILDAPNNFGYLWETGAHA